MADIRDNRFRHLIGAYVYARQAIIEAGFLAEIEWQEARDFSRLTETEFLREAAWVVLAAGMRETVVRQKFKQFSAAFLNWRSASVIVRRSSQCVNQAMKAFGHIGKIKAILEIAEEISSRGFQAVKQDILNDTIAYLQSLPFIGPITAYHLAKNIGLDVAKPDRHLVRIAAVAGYESVSKMCLEISETVGERECVVDLVLWRYATLDRNYLERFYVPCSLPHLKAA